MTVVCAGEGATDQLAEIEAKSNCDATAANEFSSRIDAQDTVIVTDGDTASHRTTTAATCVAGLVCTAPGVAKCESNGVSKIWRRCTYDLAQSREGLSSECSHQAMPPAISGQDAVANRAQLASITKTAEVKNPGAHVRGNGFVLTLSVTPSCDDLLVEGDSSRRVRCTTNPVLLSVRPGDHLVVVRAKGYLPKTIVLDKMGAESNADVYLETADK